MDRPKKIVIIGATGHFGGRLCRRLLGEPNTELVITSRDAVKANALATDLRQLNDAAIVSAVALDHSAETFEADLKTLGPDIVIHTAGPFQGQTYRVAMACIECGSHYIDLADGREFVQHFNSLHDQAMRRGVLLVSGASTLPGLSSAVVDHVRDRFEQILGIAMSIAPAHQTPRGFGTVVAVLSYCGQPFRVSIDGQEVIMHGWQNMRMQRYPNLGTRLSGACDVPDLSLLSDYAGDAQTVTFHAALEATWEQVALWTMGWLTRIGVVKNWSRFIPLFRRISEILIKLGSDVGGMQVRINGVGKHGGKAEVVWNLTARQNHGPEIPCVPALILARKLASDQVTERGAFPCLGLITLSEFDDEVSDLEIDWDIDERPMT